MPLICAIERVAMHFSVVYTLNNFIPEWLCVWLCTVVAMLSGSDGILCNLIYHNVRTELCRYHGSLDEYDVKTLVTLDRRKE